MLLQLISFAVGLACGSVPFAQLVARRRDVDLRTTGTGTVSGTGLFEVAGFGSLVVAGLADIAKSLVAVVIVMALDGAPELAGLGAVVGHNWSPWLAGAGGRGVSPTMGALVPIDPWGVVVIGGGLAAGRLVRQTGAGCFVAYLVLPFVVGRGGGGRVWFGVALTVVLLFKRFLGNRAPSAWNLRTIASRLVLDHDPGTGPGSRTADRTDSR